MVEKQKFIAHTFVITEIGREAETMKNLRRIDGVVLAKLTYGVYDGIVRTEAPTMGQLQETVTWKIRRTDHIRSTCTLIEVTDKDGPLSFEKGKNPDEFKFIHPSLK